LVRIGHHLVRIQFTLQIFGIILSIFFPNDLDEYKLSKNTFSFYMKPIKLIITFYISKTKTILLLFIVKLMCYYFNQILHNLSLSSSFQLKHFQHYQNQLIYTCCFDFSKIILLAFMTSWKFQLIKWVHLKPFWESSTWSHHTLYFILELSPFFSLSFHYFTCPKLGSQQSVLISGRITTMKCDFSYICSTCPITH
jgi:hypothetical protein